MILPPPPPPISKYGRTGLASIQHASNITVSVSWYSYFCVSNWMTNGSAPTGAWRTLHNEGLILTQFAKYYYGNNSGRMSWAVT
jgi:hypothetical protein